MNENYFFIDGSALTSQIRQLRRSNKRFNGRMLCPIELIRYYIDHLDDLHGNSYKRATFYFPTGDESAIEDFIRRPNHLKPGEIRDINFKFCGHKLKKSAEFEKFVEESVPPKYHGRFQKSEKGIDIEICCDALKLASMSKLERLFLFTNDGDFLPLFKTLKDFGANISIVHLTNISPPNADLLRESDSYDIVESGRIDGLFFPAFEALGEGAEQATNDDGLPPQHVPAQGEPETEKPDAAPSDLLDVSQAGKDSTE